MAKTKNDKLQNFTNEYVIEKTKNGFWGYSEQFPGVVSQGKNKKNLLNNLRNALNGYLYVKNLSLNLEEQMKVIQKLTKQENGYAEKYLDEISKNRQLQFEIEHYKGTNQLLLVILASVASIIIVFTIIECLTH